MFDQLADIVRDRDDGTPGWSILWDPDLCPVLFLPFLARWYGISLDPGLSELQQREAIKQTAGYRDGTPGELIGVARKHLTDPVNGTVYLVERVGGDAYHTAVSTLASQTPDPAATERALMEKKIAGETLTYTTVTGGDYATFKAVHTDYADVHAQFATYADARADPSLT
jgi:hypothetical protein